MDGVLVFILKVLVAVAIGQLVIDVLKLFKNPDPSPEARYRLYDSEGNWMMDTTYVKLEDIRMFFPGVKIIDLKTNEEVKEENEQSTNL